MELRDGALQLDGFIHSIPNVLLLREIGRGANGVVLEGHHRFIERRVAVKVWLPLRVRDARDKVAQGLAEIKKIAGAESRHVIRVYDAGLLDNRFPYATLEFVDGLTCRDWQTQLRPNLLSRISLAHSITGEMFRLFEKGVVHGDLHRNNIMIRGQPLSDLPHGIRGPDFTFVDFGTSYFSGRLPSRKRHWRVFHETIRQITQPLDIDELWRHKRTVEAPISLRPMYLHMWYRSFFSLVPQMIASFGVDINADWDNCDSWAKDYDGRDSNHEDPIVRSVLSRQAASGELVLTPELIGVIHRD